MADDGVFDECECQAFDRAVGVIMCENHCSGEEAADAIVDAARRHGVSIDDITAAVLRLAYDPGRLDPGLSTQVA